MSNTIITSSMIAREALMQLKNNLVMGNLVHREYKNEFVNEKTGGTVSIRKPVKFTATDGATLSKQDVTEGKTSIAVDQRKHVGWEFATQDLTLSIEEYSERYIKPAMITLAQQVETSLTGLYNKVPNLVGTPGTVPSTFAHLGAAGQRLDEGAVPKSPRAAVLNPASSWSLADGLKGVFVQEKAKGAFEEAKIGRYAGFDTFMGQSVKVHTVGGLGGTPLVNGASQSSTYADTKDTGSQSLITDGWTAAAANRLKKGDVITVAGVFAVNPVTKESTGVLQHFVVNADVASDGSGNATLSISPPIITSGAYQTVTAVPADNAAITVKTGTASTGYAQNLCFHKNAFAFVPVPLAMPDGAAFKARQSADNLSVRVVKDYDVTNDTDIIRLDILYGVAAIYPELATRLTA
jgi:P22 coat protein - gene protein 5